MYKDAYPTNNGKIQVSVVQLVVITLTLLVTFVLPAGAITYYRNQQNAAPYTAQALANRPQTGRVAGAATTATNIVHIPILNLDVNLATQAGVLLIGALLLAGIALIITIFLLITPSKRPSKNLTWK